MRRLATLIESVTISVWAVSDGSPGSLANYQYQDFERRSVIQTTVWDEQAYAVFAAPPQCTKEAHVRSQD
jgi:hypothetical protein